ncbi:FkbM family methyltransferase [Saccharopolyspora rhizosphaerae]|uniref:FkbM family methyltransferase n=1 Tax=Saccharopolyspora rhizosphaerae TaxID=2492662 RepID=A0A426K109_9PSEU|nr:FkbM family methyltransferase [Saccharopolyspora rhizosphaerae]RRO19186.1 FkbM family methyltransferase [Saccharopolyspora rhizosphaerae]
MTDAQPHPEPDDRRSGESAVELQSGVLEQSSESVEPEWPAEQPSPAQPAALTLLGCTVACRDQLPAARVLRSSFREHHPDAGFVLLLVDEPGAARDEPDALSITDIGVDPQEFARLAVGCTAEQLRGVLRPWLLQHLLRSGSTVLHFEPWVQVFGPFDELLTGLTAERPVALVPRVLHPLAADGLRPSPADLAVSGTFDASAFAVRPGAEGLLSTWIEQLRADPTMDAPVLDGAPALVDHQVIRDPGVGLSVFNAAQRDLELADGEHVVDGSALRSVHFDGFQPQRPWLLSADYADNPRLLLSENPLLAGLCANYRNALVDAGYSREQPHPFDALADGVLLPDGLRRQYLEAWLVAGDAPPSPFEPGGAEPFTAWACAPAEERQRAAGGSRWTAAVWADDELLQRDYPDPFGAHAEAFHEWCAGVGVASGRVPAAAVHRRTGGDLALVDQLGVAVLGTGPLADLVRTAAGASGLPSADTAYYPVVLRCSPGLAVPAGRYVIDVLTAGAATDSDAAETWVLSESSRAAVRRAGTKTRVLTLPAPERDRVDLPTRKGARARFELSDEFVIAAHVDHSAERADNALGLVSAFLSAFAERDDVRLVVGVTGAARHPEAAERLRLATASDARVVLVETDVDLHALLAAADCFVSLHRGDADDEHALRLWEVAAHGVPVIAGEHGAVAELLGGQCARLVPCQGAGEPDVEAAAEILRAAADDPEGTAAFGVAARETLLGTHTVARAGARLRERVEHAYRSWRTKWAGEKHGQFDDPLRPLLVARHALHRAPDVGPSGNNALAPALRKAVLRALSHYDEHIRDVLRSLVDGVEQTAGELLRRQEEVDGDGDVEAVRAELAQLLRRQDQFGAQLVGTDDGLVRARADLADQHRRLRRLEETGAQADAGGSDGRVDALAERIDGLTGALEKVLDRMDALEARQPGADLESGVRSAAGDAANALQRTDVLQRILLREHERATGGDGTTTPVLCDAGLVRLPADDALMLPWLSSNPTWDSEVSALIDSLLEPDGVFLDVGAYVGYQTVRVLSRLGNSGAVVAVEPSPQARALLKHNVEMNVPSAWAHRLLLVEGAAWDGPGELAAEPALAGGVSVSPAAADSEQEAGERVPAFRLDKELENHASLENLKLSVVHVDVGARVHRVLGGLVRLLRRDRPSIVCSFTPDAISGLGDDPAAALREFGTWGYELVPVGRDRPVEASDLLEAMKAAGSGSTVKLWLRPKQK